MKTTNILVIIITIELIYAVFSFFVTTEKQIQFFSQFFLKKITIQKQTTDTQAYNPYILNIIGKINKPNTISAILNNNYEGKIVDIKKNLKEKVIYPFTFRIRGYANLENAFLLTKSDIMKLQVFVFKNNQKKITSFDELRIGDTITINETLNLKYDWQKMRNQFIITQIK